ncbi:cation efflux protein [Spinellus fusiger]|nr:cation efflux protein [Spinellus fusiger]
MLYSRPIRHYGTHGHGHGHGHSHDEDHIHHGLGTALENSSKQGVRITVIGLVSNVGLTVSKGVAGVMMNSASLLADAAHSLSDLLSDFVTLYTFKMSRRKPDAVYPYGYGKYESLGTFITSLLLVAGGCGIGLHSFDLLQTVMSVPPAIEISTQNACTLMAATATHATHATEATHTTEAYATSHGLFGHLHAMDGVLDPNAAWFALASVIVKEWLYHATIKVGKKEKSDVLIANAWHHRSDAYSSVVALGAIGGSYAGLPVLDPLGGLIVSGMIIKSGVSFMLSSLRELADKGMDPHEMEKVASILHRVKQQQVTPLGFHSIRGHKVGPFYSIEFAIHMDPALCLSEADMIRRRVCRAIKTECPSIHEVTVHFDIGK